MLQLLQPIWLWASAAIVVPIIIHLWNVKQGKTLKISSLIFLEESSKQQSQSLKITEWLLLLLRCLLIILLALLLAKPQWQQGFEANAKNGWIVIPEENIASTYNHFKPTIDSLLEKKYTLHYFNTNFKKVELSEALPPKQDSNILNKMNYWQLANQLQEQLPTNTNAFLFTDNQLKNFTGKGLPLNKNINWLVYTLQDTTSEWIEDAYQTSTDSLQLVIAHSNVSATNYSYQTIAYTTTAFNNININRKQLTVQYSNQLPVTIDTSTLHITIFWDANFVSDGNYIKAAIEAVQQFTKRKIKLSFINKTTEILPSTNWLFWLSEKEIPTTGANTNIFTYARGKLENTHTLFIPNATTVSLSKLIVNNSKSSVQTLWQNNFREKLLTKEKNIYRFYSRFNPEWNDLVWEHSFPEIVYHLLYSNTSNTINANDKRIIATKQISDLLITQNNHSTLAKQPITDISHIFWLFVALLFFIERLLSFSQSPVDHSKKLIA